MLANNSKKNIPACCVNRPGCHLPLTPGHHSDSRGVCLCPLYGTIFGLMVSMFSPPGRVLVAGHVPPRPEYFADRPDEVKVVSAASLS